MDGDALLDLEIIRDLADVTAESGGSFLPGLLERFAADAHDAFGRMQRYAQAGDSAALAREAHRLKGSSGTVGARRLAVECLEIERAARAGVCLVTPLMIDHARATLDATRGGLAAYFDGTIAAAA